MATIGRPPVRDGRDGDRSAAGDRKRGGNDLRQVVTDLAYMGLGRRIRGPVRIGPCPKHCGELLSCGNG